MSETFTLHFEGSNGQYLDDLNLSSGVSVVELLPHIIQLLELDIKDDWHLTLVDRNLAIDLQQSFEQAGARSGSTIRIQSGLQRLGRYELKRQIGEGGMGVVYEGYDPNLGRQVAIKVIKEDLARNHETIARFAREARAISRLKHPNVVAVYDFVYGATDRSAMSDQSATRIPPFFVMEYVDGEPLDHIIEGRNGLPLNQVSDILTQIASALDAAHRQGIIHRDIKPANILLQPNPNNGSWIPKLVDFGLVRINEESSGITKTGIVMGSPYYMSPEQIDSKPLTPQTDVYSLGIVVYEMLTGQRPFQGSTSTKVLIDHINTPPAPPRQFRRDIPSAAEAVVLKAIAKKPEDRYQSATAFSEDFQAAVTKSAAGSKPWSSKRKWGLIAACVLVALVGIAIAGMLILKRNDVSSVTTVLGRIIFVSNRDGNSQIYAMRPDGSNQQRLTNSHLDERFPYASVDGTRIAFHAVPPGANVAIVDSQIYIVNLVTQERLPIDTKFASSRQPNWNPANEHELVFAAKQNDDWDIYVLDLLTGNTRHLVQLPGNDYYAVWSPDGQKVTFTHYDDQGKAQIYVVNADGDGLRNISNSPASDWLSAWSPNGNKIAYISNRNNANQIFVMNADGSGQHLLNVGDLPASRPTWSPDGSKIVFEGKLNGQIDIFSVNADGSNLIRLTNDPADDTAPYWR